VTELTIRASALAELFDCPARFKARHIDNMPSRTSGAAHLGTSLHAGTGLFDQAVIEQTPVTVEDAVDHFVDTVRNPDFDVDWGDKPLSEAIDTGVLLTTRYCQNIAPLASYEAVELKCDDLTLKMSNGVRLTLTGNVDRVRNKDGKRGITDLKSGARIIKNGEVDTDKHTVQLGTYELLEVLYKNTTGQDMLLDAEVVALPTQGPPIPRVATVTRPSKVLLGDSEHTGLLDVAAAMVKSGAFFGNTKSVLCSAKYCPAYAKCWWRAKD
jgi:hypothetical protein